MQCSKSTSSHPLAQLLALLGGGEGHIRVALAEAPAQQAALAAQLGEARAVQLLQPVSRERESRAWCLVRQKYEGSAGRQAVERAPVQLLQHAFGGKRTARSGAVSATQR